MVTTPEDLAIVNKELVRLREQQTALTRRINNLEILRNDYIKELKEQRGGEDDDVQTA